MLQKHLEVVMSKSEIVRQYIKSKNWKEALREAKDFRIGVSKEQRSTMARAYECIVHPAFYESIGKNLSECIEAGKAVLMEVM